MSVPADSEKEKYGGHAFTDARDDVPFFVDYELDDIGLDPYEFRVYIHALRRASGRGGSRSLWEGVMKAAKHCRMDHKTYRRSLANLVEAGLLRAAPRAGRTTEYFIAPKREWKAPLPETVDPPLPDAEGVPLPETVDEVIHRKGYTESKNLSSSDDDGEWEPPTSSAREVPAEPSSLKRFATAEELNASPKEKEPRARANNKDDALIEELAEIWNSNRGPLPRTLATTKDIRVKLQRFIRDCRESDLDPVQALTIATRTGVASGFYAKGFRGNRRARGLGNLLANGNWVKHYESGLAEGEEQAPSFDFAPGQRVRWLKHRMVPQRGYYYGVVLGEGSNDRVRIAPESGFSSDEVNIRPDFLELADDA